MHRYTHDHILIDKLPQDYLMNFTLLLNCGFLNF